MSSSLVGSYPPELLSAICAYIYAAGLPPVASSLDPLLHSSDSVPTSLPSSYPPAHWFDPSVRNSLSALCLANKAWYEAAKPWLWRKVEVRLPRSWLSLVDELAGGEDDELDQEQTALIVGETIHVAETAALTSRDMVSRLSDKDAMQELHEKVLAKLSGPDGSIPPELLTPLVSRDPSPRRLRPKSKSPARWKLIRSISVAVQHFIEHTTPGIYVPPPDDPRLGRYIRHLDFNHFRTIGMRRSVQEGVNNRFVTGERLHAVLKELPNLVSFGATEYMDGALTISVLKELFLRGSASRGRGRPSRGRDLVVFDPSDVEAEDCERRREYRELEAIDLTGCVSAVFVNALTQFVNDHLIADPPSSDSEDDGARERGRPRSRLPNQDEPLIFPCLRRLGLRGVRSVQSNVLSPFILAFPSLTHLDLSCTRVTPDVLAALGTSSTIRLQSLGLERCNWLTGESIRDFSSAHCPPNISAAKPLRRLVLPLPPHHRRPPRNHHTRPLPPQRRARVSRPLQRSHNARAPDACAPQPALRSLGLSYIHDLPLGAVADFLRTKAAHAEVLTLVATAPELANAAPRRATLALHTLLVRPLCTPPFAVRRDGPAAPPTRLRVIELASPLLAAVGAGAGAWRVVKSKGGRGWYVDVASGWIADGQGSALRRDLEPAHPWRAALERLADANGNVSSGVGWHARKMEVLHGHGFLGREAGLYGAVSFAYQG
ncbi:hypothetical protein B0H21DRAFT_854653 [Amylocystis lapponica]|nr:hypothetical protein B0H21DRAFT_854653 [Amylocystis lapponica]